MAIAKAKRSVHSAQPRPAKRARRSSSRTKFSPRRNRFFHFPEAVGKVLQDVEFATSPGYDVISLSFTDKTCLDFVIDTCFTVKADIIDRSGQEHRVLKRWPLMHGA